MQLQVSELKLITRRYNYRCHAPNYISYIAALGILVVLVWDCVNSDLLPIVVALFVSLFVAITKEWFWAKVNAEKISITCLFHFFLVFLFCCVERYFNVYIYVPLAVLGIYNRNCPFGVVHGKNFYLATYLKRNVNFPSEQKSLVEDILILPNVSVAEQLKLQKNNSETVYNVCDYGIYPNKKEDSTKKLQLLLDEVGSRGGGEIFFPKGRYYFNKNKKCSQFIQLNFSNLRLRGEVDLLGRPLAELYNCCPTLRGCKNPWLSPFFITTGETLQKSNIFWGLQFKAKKNIITRSGSLADPGSDGTILTPSFVADIVQDSLKNDSLLRLSSTHNLSSVKYILIGLYNSTEDGDLVKDVLGVSELREEWGTARRAGEEIAPSVQWLVEIKRIVNDHLLELTQPLRFDCLTKYSPAVFAVDMLENIEICDLKLSSNWNGLFRHHGFPFYYSIGQTKEMDYGWNAINFKRVAHGLIENVTINNYTNPLYLMDCREVHVNRIYVNGYDGHQGIKLYEHACDNLVENIVFDNHYADMLGGEGNSYGNVFDHVVYRNPVFKPVDFDFHGFSEGPMSPPAFNFFRNIGKFRYIKAAGALYNQPACAQYNVWQNIVGEGERKGDNLFVSLPYVPKGRIAKYVSVIRHALVVCMQYKKFSAVFFKNTMKERLAEVEKIAIEPKNHWKLFPNSILVNYKTSAIIQGIDERVIHCFNSGEKL